MMETWYVLADGSLADPADMVTDDRGVLSHRDGRAVAMRGDVPLTRSVDVKERAKARPKARAKDMKPEEKPFGYVTRESNSK